MKLSFCIIQWSLHCQSSRPGKRVSNNLSWTRNYWTMSLPYTSTESLFVCAAEAEMSSGLGCYATHYPHLLRFDLLFAKCLSTWITDFWRSAEVKKTSADRHLWALQDLTGTWGLGMLHHSICRAPIGVTTRIFTDGCKRKICNFSIISLFIFPPIASAKWYRYCPFDTIRIRSHSSISAHSC